MKYLFINNKKIIRFSFVQMIILLFLCINNVCFGISNEFKYVIDTIGIPEVNLVGEHINEQIYNVYKVFAYSDPIQVMNKTNMQRFKYVENKGKWYEESTGRRGEYYILGTDYSGNLVTNVYFPVDFVPESLPTNWNYIYNESAFNSWNDSSKYKYIEQLEYMKNSNIWFDKIDFVNNTCDSYNLVEYNISANKIGLDKAFLETCATWTTSGVINIKRLTPNNKVRYATFFVKPMAASADLESFLEVEDVINVTPDNKKINIKFGASAINLTDYAKEEHIKEINADIYINDIKIDNIKLSKTKNLRKEILYELPEEIFQSADDILNIKVKSYLYTEFSVDGLMQDVVEKNVTIQKENSNNNIVPADNIKVLEKEDNTFVVSDLIKTKNTEECDSVGIIEKGRKLVVKIDNKKCENKDNIKVYINDIECKAEFLDSNDNIVVILPIEEQDGAYTLNTIETWKYLKHLNNNYFDIDFRRIGKRIKEANTVKIVLNYRVYSFWLDVVDEYNYNMNYTFLDNVVNLENIKQKIRLEEWIK